MFSGKEAQGWFHRGRLEGRAVYEIEAIIAVNLHQTNADPAEADDGEREQSDEKQIGSETDRSTAPAPECTEKEQRIQGSRLAHEERGNAAKESRKQHREEAISGSEANFAQFPT
jgi:hypothetical protein